ncbi:MAG: hypothetical protein JXA41_05130 [Deltaproteobacteria bacterium]|nr:hypothetical protein [Deltaproteobacteria bacterium]
MERQSCNGVQELKAANRMYGDSFENCPRPLRAQRNDRRDECLSAVRHELSSRQCSEQLQSREKILERRRAPNAASLFFSSIHHINY